MGSRSLQTGGSSAIHVASNEVLERAKQIAAHLLEADVDDIVVGDGGLQVAGVPSRGVSWPTSPLASAELAKLPDGIEPAPLRHELDFDGTDSTFPFGAHVAVVEVDTETGGVRLVRHIAVDDCGRILNPLLVAGQQHGGIAQGAAQALYEQVAYDEDGNPITANLVDYAIPSAAELPSFEVVEHPDRQPAQPARRQGHRRVGHDRLDPGDPERGRRRRLPPRRQAHRHAVHAAAGLAGDPRRRSRTSPTHGVTHPQVFDTLPVRGAEDEGEEVTNI